MTSNETKYEATDMDEPGPWDGEHYPVVVQDRTQIGVVVPLERYRQMLLLSKCTTTAVRGLVSLFAPAKPQNNKGKS